MSICARCGKDHDAWGGVCPSDDGKPASQGAANALQTSGRTMFGVAPAPIPVLPKPAARPAFAATLLASAARIPMPARPVLPTAEEARQNPNLVISLDKASPLARPASGAPARRITASSPVLLEPTPAPVRAILGSPAAKSAPEPAPSPAIQLDRDEPAPDRPVDLPDVGPPIDLPSFVTPGVPEGRGDLGEPQGSQTRVGAGGLRPPEPERGRVWEPSQGSQITDLPRPGSTPRFALPAAPAEASANPSVPPHRRAARGFVERLTADLKSVVDLLAWASTFYFGRAKQLLWLVALLVIPAALLESCMVAGITSRTTTISITATTVDFSARKAELAALIQDSQSRGRLDAQAVAELAALTAAETAHLPVPAIEVERGGGWLRERLAFLVSGLLILGLAFPIASGLLALAFYDKESGAATPGFADVWPILVARGGLLLVTLLPSAALVALGYALYVVPGLVLSVLFLFLPHVVLFEQQGGRAALARGMELVRGDLVRVVFTFLVFALAGAVVALLAELLLPAGVSRASAFLRFLLCDLLALAVLPIPALVLASLYLDARLPSGGTAERLARAARS